MEDTRQLYYTESVLDALRNLVQAADQYWEGKEDTMPELDSESANGNAWITALNEAKAILSDNI